MKRTRRAATDEDCSARSLHRWHHALMALREINQQAEVSAMFDDRYTGFDHVFGPELERAHAWITELHRRFFDG